MTNPPPLLLKCRQDPRWSSAEIQQLRIKAGTKPPAHEHLLLRCRNDPRWASETITKLRIKTGQPI